MNERSVPSREARVQGMSTAITGSPGHRNGSHEQEEGAGKDGGRGSDPVPGNPSNTQGNPGSSGSLPLGLGEGDTGGRGGWGT